MLPPLTDDPFARRRELAVVLELCAAWQRGRDDARRAAGEERRTAKRASAQRRMPPGSWKRKPSAGSDGVDRR